VAGVFLLRGARWARWLVLAWLAFHVVVSALNSLSDAMAHVVLLLVVGYFLLGPPASKYFSVRKQNDAIPSHHPQRVVQLAVSSPGESHPEALVEPYVSLSTHTAPIAEPGRVLSCQ